MKSSSKKQTRLNFPVPEGWRKGQTIFNFLWWLKDHRMFSSEFVEFDQKGGMVYAKTRMADPFNIPDKQLEALFEEFLLEH